MVNKGVVLIGDVSGNTASINVSGQLKVEANVTIPPISVASDVSGNTVYLRNDGVNNVVSISGQTVVADVAVETNVSGNAVRISGQHVSVSGIVTVNSLPVISVSGNALKISGETVAIAGGISSNVSGNTVYLIDDSVNNRAKISGQHVSVSGIVAVNSLPVVSVSGNMVSISGQPVTGSFTASVSGQPVLISGQTVVASVTTDISGQTVRITDTSGIGLSSISGFLRVSISGQPVTTSVNVTTNVSGQHIVVSDGINFARVFTDTSDAEDSDNNSLVVTPFLMGYNEGQDVWSRLRMTGSGDGYRLLVSISGQPIQGSFTASVSGQPVRISGSAVGISGQLVAVSGAVATLSGSITSISGETVYFVDDSVRNKVKISGQLVAVSGIVNIGNSSIAVTLPAFSTSGDASRISGQLVAVSGTVMTVSGSIASISGETVYFIDDSVRNRVKISGQTVSVSGIVNIGNSLTIGTLPLISVSGNVVSVLSGSVAIHNTPTVTLSSNIVLVSGQTIYFIDDSVNNKVKISGQLVAVSGVVSIGNNLTIASLPVISVSGNAIKVSGETVAVSGIVAVNSLPVISVSGSTVRLPNDGVNNVVQISGQVVVASVTTNISGQTIYTVSGNNTAQISGQLVAVSGIVAVNSLPVISVSGNVVRVSGETVSVSGVVNIGNNPVVHISGGLTISGNAVRISGEAVRVSGQSMRQGIPTAIRTRPLLPCANLSGGTQLLSGDVSKATIVNAGSGTGANLYVGSTTDPPYSGFGLFLIGGNGITMEVDNFDRVRVFAVTSGTHVSYIGEQY